MNKKKVLWSLLFLVIAGLTIWAVASWNKEFSIEHFLSFIKASNKIGILGAIISMLGFIFFEGLAILCVLKGLGFKKKAYQGLIYSGADVYFSAITPSASGGQPASAFFMMKDKIPGPVVTVTLLVNLIMYTIALLSLGGLCILFKFDVFMKFSVLSKVFILIGIMVLLGLCIIFLLLLKNAKVLYTLCDRILYFLEKMHLLKKENSIRNRILDTMDEYKDCSKAIQGKKRMLLETLLWNICQRLSQFLVVFMVFLAQKEGIEKAIEAFFIQCFVSLGSNCVPIPGAMGVADMLMVDGFSQMMSRNSAVMMELLCRSISFYGCIIVSLGIVAITLLIQKIRSIKC